MRPKFWENLEAKAKLCVCVCVRASEFHAPYRILSLRFLQMEASDIPFYFVISNQLNYSIQFHFEQYLYHKHIITYSRTRMCDAETSNTSD
jgi:hypothetical protein